ncbi:MAG: hypothetical protein HKL85_09800 [Acidimicrobiaceae bacterium]|nr:hypothetical protein [Acidimicrobiaceae bacterium]
MTTTVASSAVASRDDSPCGQRVSWLRLMHVALIQHRAALVTIFVAFVTLAIAIVIGRDAVSASYASYLAAGCTLAHPIDLGVCVNAANQYSDIPSFTPLVSALRLFPLVIGAFVGAPLVAREMESGTYRFAWTQGVGRTRLVLVTLAMLTLIVTPVAVVLGFLLGGWYIHPYAVINIAVGSHWQSGLFTTTWWMTPVWTLFALTLGTLVGAVVKRTVASIATTVVIIGGVLAAVSQFLPRILDIGAVASSRLMLSYFPLGTINTVATVGVGPSGSLLVRGWFVGPGGLLLGSHAANRVREHVIGLYQSKSGANDPGAAMRWLTLHHYTYWFTYQPADHFWILQAVVGLVLLAVASLCVLGTVRIIQHSRS